ncbi:hypothetical protein PM3016_538 [Paenibacillus mucilaginosus 3016]|uniref:Uncharacterized protein n=1 Tax=Paenibacillus mucilaginosus 3016 TaxID=1116391 RepID=H6NSW4_9BACL|nr:hypothetical protein PM3016_538 [Paenibacillus mucilaginosus 3016]
MFSKASSSSISFAIVTPSLVMSGEPNFFLEYHVAAFRTECNFNGIRQSVNPAEHRAASVFAELNFFSHE